MGGSVWVGVCVCGGGGEGVRVCTNALTHEIQI